MGGAGLYALMSELVVANRFALPSEVPFYGPGGIPFAYPPVAFYLAAFSTSLLNISIFDYLRYAPAVIGLLSAVAMYMLTKQITASKAKASVAAVLIATTPVLWHYHVIAAGMARGPAFLFSLLGLTFAYGVLQNTQGSNLFFASVFFGLTIATHLSYAVFFVLSLAVFVLVVPGHGLPKRTLYGTSIVICGLILSSPWWLTLIMRHGISVFYSPALTHGTMGFVELIAHQPWLLLRRFYWGIGGIPLLILTLLGLVSCLRARRWFLPFWLIAAMIFLGEGQRFVETIAVIVAVDYVVNCATPMAALLPKSNAKKACCHLLRLAAPTVLFVALSYANMMRFAISSQPELSTQMLETADWFQSNTPLDATYVFPSTSDVKAEWMPYLLRRTSLAGPWGAEWTGTHVEEAKFFSALTNCARLQSLPCVEALASRDQEPPDFLVLSKDASSCRLLADASQSTPWSLAFENAGYAVFERKD